MSLGLKLRLAVFPQLLRSGASLSHHLCRLEVVDHFLQVVHLFALDVVDGLEFLRPASLGDLEVGDHFPDVSGDDRCKFSGGSPTLCEVEVVPALHVLDGGGALVEMLGQPRDLLGEQVVEVVGCWVLLGDLVGVRPDEAAEDVPVLGNTVSGLEV